jgi:hypothetical protein
MLRNYGLSLSNLNFRTLYSRRRNLDASFLINYQSIMDTTGIRVPSRQIRYSSTFCVSSALRNSLSPRRIVAAYDICRFLDIYGKNIVSFEDTSILKCV